jgi:hypothetical protein
MGIKIKLKDKCFWGTKNPDVVRNIFDIMKLRGGGSSLRINNYAP